MRGSGPDDVSAIIAVIGVFIAIVVGIVKAVFSSSSPDSEQSENGHSIAPVPVRARSSSRKSVPQRELHELLPKQFVVFDLETTGLSSTKNEIIEIGAIKVTLGESSHDGFQTLVKPTRKIPREATAINHITQEMVNADGMELAEALREFKAFIGDLPLVSFNAAFDMGFLWNAANKCDITIPNSYDCALKRSRRAWPDLPSHKLSYLAKIGGLSSEDEHRALGDCQRTITVYISSVETLNQKVRWKKPETQELPEAADTVPA